MGRHVPTPPYPAANHCTEAESARLDFLAPRQPCSFSVVCFGLYALTYYGQPIVQGYQSNEGYQFLLETFPTSRSHQHPKFLYTVICPAISEEVYRFLKLDRH